MIDRTNIIQPITRVELLADIMDALEQEREAYREMGDLARAERSHRALVEARARYMKVSQ